MRGVRVDMHTHTEFSPDSRTKLASFVRAAAEAGLDVVCVTDHNTIEGALRLRELDAPFEVVIGEEISAREGEIIGLFLGRPIARGFSAEETLARIHEQGGIAYVPHPFSRNRRHHLRRAALERIISQVDALEVFNAREAFAGDNRRALAFAVKHGVAGGAGSDAHRSSELGRVYVEVPPFSGARGLLEALPHGQISGRLSGVGAHFQTRYDVLRKWLAHRRRT